MRELRELLYDVNREDVKELVYGAIFLCGLVVNFYLSLWIFA